MTYPPCPDPNLILAGLKDFQRCTVDYVFRRLYTDPDATNRFLIADEVGLGKTLVARGLIARTIQHLWSKVEQRQIERIDIVYICSNAEIARQNIQKLNITGTEGFSLASRITLLPVQMHNLQQNRTNFISFTPGTSFDVSGNLGKAEERIVLHQLLADAWGYDIRKAAPLNIFRGKCGSESFREQVSKFRHDHSLDASLAEAFRTKLQESIQQDRANGKTDLQTRFNELCYRFRRVRKHVPKEDKQLRNQFVGDLRSLLAHACISALEPDLIIMDEFQRFKHLLNFDPDNEASQLAHELFNYQDTHSSVKVVLLSATPYKMYTMAHEQAEDNHYADFLQTVRFLKPKAFDSGQFEQLLSDYRRGLLSIKDDNLNGLVGPKTRLEQELQSVMARTERLSASADRNGMLQEVPCLNTRVTARDLQDYLSLQHLASLLEQHDILEYWKSAPYLLNFMENYEIKQKFSKEIENSQQLPSLLQVLKKNPSLLLAHKDLATYQAIDPGNARLRELIAGTIDSGAWKLLWMPPALPYYELAEPFNTKHAAQFTKRLVFSSWQVVPKMIATLLSYEAERWMMLGFNGNAENSAEARKNQGSLLRFGRSKERKSNQGLTGMPVLGLLYPSTVLARECDPLAFAIQGDRLPSQSELLEHTRRKITDLLNQLFEQPNIRVSNSGVEDESWYWAAPILLDWHFDRKATQTWFEQASPSDWNGAQTFTPDGADDSLWADHVNHAKQIINSFSDLGKRPADLSFVLAQLAIASPAITALRSLTRILATPDADGSLFVRTKASQIAWSFRRLFNQPEVTALLRAKKPKEPYWRRVLGYCLDGGLQAVLDEYMHMLSGSPELMREEPQIIMDKLAKTITEALSLRTSVMHVDEVRLQKDQITLASEGCFHMRGHFAMRFGDNPSDDEGYLNRADQVRDAFNSPFRPFVLASTSLGQEGLDFHTYCHAIVHWNLPSNPVDLEQREGRIHRYKGHAIRKNLVQEYSIQALESSTANPWEHLFELAVQHRNKSAQEQTDLVPFWILEGDAKIERHVPNIPLSRDVEKLEALKRSLTVYRMVFGQNKQDDLVEFLLKSLPPDQIAEITQAITINLEPPR